MADTDANAEINASEPTESASTSASTDAPQTATDISAQPEEKSVFDSAPSPEDVWSAPSETEEAKVEEEKPEIAAEPEKPAESTEEVSEEDAVLDDLFKESKDEPDEDLKDEEAKIASFKNPRAQAWADRRHKRAKYVDDFIDGDKPVAEVAERFAELSPARYQEFSQHLAHSLVDANPDATFRRAYVQEQLKRDPNFDWQNAEIPSLSEIIQGRPEKAQPTSELSQLTDELTKKFDFDWRDPANDDQFLDDRERELAQALRVFEAAEKAKSSELATKDEKLKEIEEKLKGIDGKLETESAKQYRTTLAETVSTFRESVAQKVLPRIARVTGLEVNKDDTPEIVGLKESLMVLYKGTPWEIANKQDSQFEVFAYNESSVKDKLDKVIDRVFAAQTEESQAKIKGDAAKAEKFHKAADEERIALYELFATAEKEFRAQRVTPILTALGSLSTSLTTQVNESSQRIEVIGSGGQPSTTPKEREYKNANDVWDAMPEDARQEAALGA